MQGYLEHENVIDQGLDALMEVLCPLCEGWQVAGLCCDRKGLQLPQQLTLRAIVSISATRCSPWPHSPPGCLAVTGTLI